MAGKRQHFIPQFIQNGFASHVVRNEVFTWVYRKGTKAFNANIKNVGVEGFFYSDDNNSEIDDIITAAEGAFAQLVNKLRKDSQVNFSDSVQVKQLFAHLEVRTRHIRQSFFTTGNHLLNELLVYLSDPASCESFLTRRIKNDPSLIRDALSDELGKRGFSQEVPPILMQLCGQLIEQAMPSMVDQMDKMVAYLKAEMPVKLSEASRSGHIKALAQTIIPDVKVRRYETFNFNVETSGDASLPLGDSAVLFHVDGARKFKPFLENNDVLIAILLPISPTQVLVGSERNYKLDFSGLPHTIASSSLEYFIASEASSENEGLSCFISENALLLTRSQIEKLIDEITNA